MRRKLAALRRRHNPANPNRGCAFANITLLRGARAGRLADRRASTAAAGAASLRGMKPALSPVRRRVVFALLFEGIGLVLSTAGLMLFSGTDAATAGGAAVGTMALALIYNYLFNWAFEAWERRQPVRGRGWKRRLAHGALFEAG